MFSEAASRCFVAPQEKQGLVTQPGLISLGEILL